MDDKSNDGTLAAIERAESFVKKAVAALSGWAHHAAQAAVEHLSGAQDHINEAKAFAAGEAPIPVLTAEVAGNADAAAIAAAAAAGAADPVGAVVDATVAAGAEAAAAPAGEGAQPPAA